MKLFTSVFCFIFILMVKGNAQPANFNTLICNTWKISYYEHEGKKISPMPQQKNDKMVFYTNHKVKSFESGHTQIGTWNFDLSSNLLVITDDINKAKAMMRVGKINAKECVLEFNDPKGQLVKLHMIVAAK